MKAHGFSLIEVLVAIAIVMTGVASLAQLSVVSARANRMAGASGATLILASQRLERLLNEIDPGPSPFDALVVNTPGFVDYLDQGGKSLGGVSGTPPSSAAFVCRWSIHPAFEQPA